MKKAGVNRFLMVGGAGSLFIAPALRLMDSGEVPENILPGVKALGEFWTSTDRNRVMQVLFNFCLLYTSIPSYPLVQV